MARDFTAALAQAEVLPNTLTDAERRKLDDDGYLVLANLIDRDALAGLERALALAAGVVDDPSASGTRHLELDLRDEHVAALATHPRLLAAAHHVLQRPFRLVQLHGREPRPGFGRQGLHADWLPRTSASASYAAVTAIWTIDAFERNNGATRLVPGTHRQARAVPRRYAEPRSLHPDEITVVAPAGSLLVFNGHLWHAGTENASPRSRRAVQVVFVAEDRVTPTMPPLEIPFDAGVALRMLTG